MKAAPGGLHPPEEPTLEIPQWREDGDQVEDRDQASTGQEEVLGEDSPRVSPLQPPPETDVVPEPEELSLGSRPEPVSGGAGDLDQCLAQGVGELFFHVEWEYPREELVELAEKTLARLWKARRFDLLEELGEALGRIKGRGTNGESDVPAQSAAVRVCKELFDQERMLELLALGAEGVSPETLARLLALFHENAKAELLELMEQQSDDKLVEVGAGLLAVLCDEDISFLD